MRISLGLNALSLALLIVAALCSYFGFRHTMFAFCTAAALLIAVSLYRMRCNNKLLYGSFELVAALGFFYFLMSGLYRAVGESMTVELVTSRMLTLFAAVYFMVRALDNIGQGLTGDHSVRWKRFFERTKMEGHS